MYETTCHRIVKLYFAVRLQSHVLFRNCKAVSYRRSMPMSWLPGTLLHLSPITMNKHWCVVPRVHYVHQRMVIPQPIAISDSPLFV